MPSCEQIAFQPALAKMLAEHFHHAPVWRDMVIRFQNFGSRGPLCDLEDMRQMIRCCLIGSKQSKIAQLLIGLYHIADESAHDQCSLCTNTARKRNIDRIAAKIRDF